MTNTMSNAMMIPAATLVVALGGLFAPAAARAGELLQRKLIYRHAELQLSPLEQCEAAISGTYAARLRDPFLRDDGIETMNHSSDTE